MINIIQQSDGSLVIPESMDYTFEKITFNISFFGSNLERITHIKVIFDGKEYMFHRPLYFKPTDIPWSQNLETGFIRPGADNVSCTIVIYYINNYSYSSSSDINIVHHQGEGKATINKLVYSQGIIGCIMTVDGNTELYVLDE